MKFDLEKTPRMGKNGMIRNIHIVTYTFCRTINNELQQVGHSRLRCTLIFGMILRFFTFLKKSIMLCIMEYRTATYISLRWKYAYKKFVGECSQAE